MNKKKRNNLQIRNSTAEFLIFSASNGEKSIEVKYEDENVWLNQKMISVLFGVSIPTINEHIKNIFNSGELEEKGTIRKFLIVQEEGKRDVSRKVDFYNLEGIISVGFRVNSSKAIEFRNWAKNILKEFAIKGFVLDKDRLKNGNYLGEHFFEDLLLEIKEIRVSERKFFQKITDIFTTAIDYDSNSQTTKKFFATVQNKLHFSIHGNTAAEIITKRAHHTKENMGLSSWKNSSSGKIIKSDVNIAKNYLLKEELEALDRIVNMYLDYGEDQAKRKIPLTMQDWNTKLNAFLQFNEREILSGNGKVTAEIAKSFAESEFKQYRIIQDRLYESDFDALLKKQSQLK